MHVIDVATGKDLADVIAGTKYAAASWTPDGRGFYYTWVPPVGGDVTTAARPGFAELRYHALGSDPAKDPVVHEATHDAATFLGGALSRDGHWLFALIQHGWNSSDVYFKDPHGNGRLADAGRGRAGGVQRRSVARSLLRHDQRRRAALPRLRRRSQASRARRVEGDRAAAGRHARGSERRRRAPRAALSAERRERGVDPRSARQARAQARRARARHDQRRHRQPRRGHRVRRRTRRSRCRRSSTRRRSRRARSTSGRA